ncbi:MAG: RsmD family RNA methyltransferase, partial [Phycisphaerae bacterium]|nr:RsmD family RNA methyltransferase [Phycisphaerae bacterium]
GAHLAEPGYIPDVPVLDLFAGAGTLGIECLSRGASWACFIERRGPAARALRENIRNLGAEDVCQIVQGDALRAEIPTPPDGRYGLVFVDPPYRMTERPTPGDAVVQRIVELGSHPAVADDALLLLRQDEHAQRLPPMPHWTLFDERSIGTMRITTLSRGSEADASV